MIFWMGLLNAFLNLLKSMSCIPLLFQILFHKACTMLCHMCCKTGNRKQYNTWNLIKSHPVEIKYLRLNYAEKISYKIENPFFGINPQQEIVYRGNLFQHMCFTCTSANSNGPWYKAKQKIKVIFCENFKIFFNLRSSELEQWQVTKGRKRPKWASWI